MFDDQTPSAQSNQPASNPPKIGWHKLDAQNAVDRQQPSQNGSPPPNLPIAQDKQNNTPKAPDDIFSQVDQNGDDNVEKSAVNNFSSSAPVIKKNDSKIAAGRNFLNQQPPPEITVPQPPLSVDKQKSFLKNFYIFVLSAVILSLLIVGGILIYKIFTSSKFLPINVEDGNPIIDDLAINEENNLDSPPVDESKIEPNPIIVNPPPIIESELPPKSGAVLDTDLDKIPDAEEIEIGTNPRAQDTDFDKLTDYEEVYIYKTDPLKKDSDNDQITDAEEINIYKTDPLKNDTDGDGYSDGQEIKNGYNPKGEGKLGY